MRLAEAYIPIDRRVALSTGDSLQEASIGAALFVDISGFTPLTNALRKQYGPRRGAEVLTQYLNQIYATLISAIEQSGGSVIGFSGDAITSWYFASATTALSVHPKTELAPTAYLQESILRAIAAALTIQRQMGNHGRIALHDIEIILSVKTAIAAGSARRFIVGDPEIQQIDVLAGATVDQMAATEQMASEGELWLAGPTAMLVEPQITIQEWQRDQATHRDYAKVIALETSSEPIPWPVHSPLAHHVTRQWILPAIEERLQNQQDHFIAELRPAAALFVRFTGIDYDCDPAASTHLNAYIRWAQRIIHHHGGALIQLTTGDKGSYFYATFGAPIAHDNDIERAVIVALQLQSTPEHFPYLEPVQIGISYGTMRVGPYGSETRRTYGVLGNETNMAARFMAFAKPGQIVIGEEVHESITDRYITESLGLVPVKGRARPQSLYTVLERRQAQRRVPPASVASLVGRENEQRQLQQHVEQLRQGHGSIVRIEGNAGLGKSHLVTHFLQAIEPATARIIYAAGQSTAQDTAYFAMRQLMWELLALDVKSFTGEQLTKTLADRNEKWRVRLPLLGDILGIEIPDNETTATFDARLRQEALTALAVDIVVHYAQREALLLVIDDIHWLDEASQGILLALARVVLQAPILLLLVHRPATVETETFLQTVEDLPSQTHLSLEELTVDGVTTLIEQRLGGPVTPLVATLVQTQAQGNPFFTEELVNALQEQEQLLQQDERWTLEESLIERLRNAGCLVGHLGEERIRTNAALAEIETGIPTTIQGIILARLDRLPESVKVTVKVASVIGRIFAQDLLTMAHPRQPTAEILDKELSTLLTREFARVEAPAPHPIYIFKHNITQEVVYQTLLTDQRQGLHEQVAHALETLQPENIEALAMHYYNSDLAQAKIHTKALHYLDAAGHRAQRDYANETALSYFNRALGLEQRVDWLKAKVEILHILGRRNEEKDALDQFAQIGEIDLGEIDLRWGTYFEALSEYEEAQRHLQQALQRYQALGAIEGTVQALNQLGTVAGRQADYAAAEQYFQQALTQIDHDERFLNERAALLYGLSIVNRQQGNYAQAKALLGTALTLHRSGDNRQGEARILTALGVLAHMQRDYETAEEFYQQALTIQQMIGDRTGEGGSLMSLGQIIRSRGDYSKAIEMINIAVTIFEALNNRWWLSIAHNELGIVAMMTGLFKSATEQFEQSLKISNAIQDLTAKAIALLNLGQAARDSGEIAMAFDYLNQSKAIVAQQGNKYLLAQCWSDLALCFLQQSAWQRAHTNSQKALELFEELGFESATVTEFCTMAEATLHLGDQATATDYISRAFHSLKRLDVDEFDYPQRDYFTCYRIFRALEHQADAQDALSQAHAILQKKAAQISDQETRLSFLTNVTFNRRIIEAAP